GEGLEGDQPVQGVAALDLGERRLDLLAVPGVEAVADPVGPRRDDRPAVEGHRTLLGVSHQQVTSPDRQGLHDRAHGGDLGAVRAGGQGQQVAAVADERGAGDTGSPCALRALGALPARGALGAVGAVGHAVLVSWGSVFGAGSSGSCGSGSGSISTTSSRRGPCTPSTRSSSMSLVALGPEIIVQAAAGSVFIRSMPLGPPRTPWSARAASTTITWRSGTRLTARRPLRSSPPSTMVPVDAIAVWQPVSTASIPFSSRGPREPASGTTRAFSSRVHSGGRAVGTTTCSASPRAVAIAAGAWLEVVRCTTAV